MANAKAKTINLLLYEGDLGGVISIEDSNWNAGELYSAPRESVNDLLSTDACNKFGVYLLLSHDMVYVGQSSDLAKRITQHTVGKDWWTSVVILTTKDDSLNHSDIDFLEYNLIELAQSINKLDCDNKKKGNVPKVDKFRKVVLQQYMDEALFLMQLIGINVFSDKKSSPKTPQALIDTMDVKAKLTLGRRVKREAIDYAVSQGATIGKKNTYAVRQEKKAEFWANPKKEFVDVDWYLVLNDNVTQQLIIMYVPAGSMSLYDGTGKGLRLRNKPNDKIDLNIDAKSFIDRLSGEDFSKYIIQKINY